MLFTADFPASSMQGIQHATSRRASFGKYARRFSRETGRRDLRRPSGHPASLRLPAQSGTRRSFHPPQTPLYQIHSVASFYPHFHLAPPPKADIRVCADMSCHLNGSCELRADLERRFANSRTEDVQIRDVSCLGRCDHAPAISINGHIFTHVTAEHAEQLAR